jgi:hypothetical protein
MIKISKESEKILRKCIEKHDKNFLWVLSSQEMIDVDHSLGNDLRDIVFDELALSGFDKNYEPNEYGYKLEDLIDEIGRLFLYKK